MGWLDPVVEWITNLMNTIGGVGVMLGILLENIFPPIPSEVILPLAGFTAASPDAAYGLVGAIIWATAGSVLGAWLLYWIGRWIGISGIRWCFEKLPLLKAADVDKTMAWFDRHGTWTVLVGRLLPIFRSLISIPAGIAKMNQVVFLGLTTLGSLVWNSILVGAGYLLGDNWHKVTDVMERFSTVFEIIIALVLVAIVVWLVLRARKDSTARKATDEHPMVVEETVDTSEVAADSDPTLADPLRPRADGVADTGADRSESQ